MKAVTGVNQHSTVPTDSIGAYGNRGIFKMIC